MATIVPLDRFVTDEWYPGCPSGPERAPWVAERLDTFRAEDEARFWFLDFHWPRGFTPMGTLFLEDCVAWGTQLAAQSLPLPTGKGIVGRLAGTHLYSSEVPVDSTWETNARSERLSRSLPSFLERFPQIWAERVWELETGFTYFQEYEIRGRSRIELSHLLIDARTYQKRAWEIHFEIMYPLLANYHQFYGVCCRLGLDAGEISKYLQGYDTKILECDRALGTLATKARQEGLGQLFAATPVAQLQQRLLSDGAVGRRWLVHFEDFLQRLGWRTEGISDIALAPWAEDPTSPLGHIKTSLMKTEDHNFEAAHTAAVSERDTAIDTARSRLTKGEQADFDNALASCQHANFAWWNDEHNYYIDLRATLPLRRACIALADAVDADRRDDTLYCFWPELMAVATGRRDWQSMRSLVRDRRDYYEYWEGQRPSMPKVLGTIPEEVADPILIEIFGMHHHFFSAVRAEKPLEHVLRGVAASAGTVRGLARVLHNSDLLHQIEPGEVLVCEATSPNWTPAFAKISACVCDGGGMLTHASITSREYRIPCVVGVGLATAVIKDGDEVEVDGDKGIVTVIRAAGHASLDVTE
jgi:phosphohistidine swiveling domain-containing protein